MHLLLEFRKSKAKLELIKEKEQNLREIEERNTIIIKGQTTYRQQLKEISTSTHPFSPNSQLKTSVELCNQLSSSLAILRGVAEECGIKDKKKHLNYFENNIPEMSVLVDFWWKWVNCDLENQGCPDELKEWLKTKLLPTIYWKQQIKKSRSSKELKAYYIDLYRKSEKVLYASYEAPISMPY